MFRRRISYRRQRALSGNVFMGWDMNLEDRYREFVRLICLATTVPCTSRECTGWPENAAQQTDKDFYSRRTLLPSHSNFSPSVIQIDTCTALNIKKKYIDLALNIFAYFTLKEVNKFYRQIQE